MDNKLRKYEIIVNNSINILKSFSCIAILLLVLIGVLNKIYDVPKAWNVSFLIPMPLIFIATVIQFIVCFWRIGKINEKNLDSICNRKSNLIFSACITYIVFIAMFIVYALLVIILY